MSHDSPWLAELTHLDKNARLRAVMALGQAAESESLPALLQQLRVEPDFFVRDNLCWAIARCGEGAAVPLIALLADGAADVRYHAAHALSKLGDVRAVDALITLLDDVDADVVQKAVFALGRLRDTRALPALASQIGGGTRELVIARKEAFEVVREVHGGHTAGAELAVDAVTVSEGGGEASDGEGHKAGMYRRHDVLKGA